MKPILFFILIFQTTLAHAQTELAGSWKLESYQIEGKKPIEIDRRVEKSQLTFNDKGQYELIYYTADFPEGVRVHMNLLDRKLEYVDQNGVELKSVRSRRKKERGTYKVDGVDELLFSCNSKCYRRVFQFEGNTLSVADTLDNLIVWQHYKRKD